MDERSILVAERWLTRAQSDLRIGRAILEDHEADDAWASCVHAHQAAEKSVKTVLVAFGTDFPKTHDLARLVDLTPPGTPVPVARDELEWLTYFATAGRYVVDDPMGAADPGWHDAERALADAADLLAWAEQRSSGAGPFAGGPGPGPRGTAS